MFHRLFKSDASEKIFDWVSRIEREEKKVFKIRWDGSYLINIPYTQGEGRPLLDNERSSLIPAIVAGCNMRYDDEDQKKSIEEGPLKDFFGWSVWIRKTICNLGGREFTLSLEFDYRKRVVFRIYGDMDIIREMNLVDPEQIKSDHIVADMMDYCLDTPQQRDRLTVRIKQFENLLRHIRFPG